MQELVVDFITSLDGYGAAEGWPGFWGLEGPEYLAWLEDHPEADSVVLMGANSATELYLFAIMFGLSRANGALVSASVIDLYGRNAVGSILGYTTTFHQLFAALGAWVGGLAYDMTGSYTLALAPCIVLLLGGATASLLIDEQRPERRIQPSVVSHQPAAGG